MSQINRRFIAHLKTCGRPIYSIGREAGFSPNTIYKVLRGIQEIDRDDPRLRRLAETVGFPPNEIFENSNTEV